jgi:predicted nucleic acid-binding Zn ribbon protein
VSNAGDLCEDCRVSDSPEHDPRGFDLAKQIARAARGASPKPRRKTKSTPSTDGPTPIGELLGEVMDAQGWTKDLNVHQLLNRWTTLVGPVNAAHCEPEHFADGVLTVRAESSTWAASLRTMAPQLVAVLNEALGQGSVTRVAVVGPAAPNWKKGRRSVAGRGPRDTYG